MKNLLQFSGLLMAVTILASTNLFAQEYLIQEGFVENGTPAGWTVKDVSYSSASSNAANKVFPEQTYCAKMKTNNNECWLQFPKVNGAGTLSFWCKVKDAAILPHVSIQKSVDDGANWVDVAVDPPEIDLADDSTFQSYTLDINQSGGVILRIYVTSETAGTNTAGTLTVDDIQVTSMAAAADDASLIDLTINGTTLPGFIYDSLNYEYEFWFGAESWVVDAVPNNENATVNIVQATSIDGSEAERTATVTVTSADQSKTETYTVLFSESPYVFATGFVKTGDNTFDDESWERSYTYQSTNIPGPGNHGELEGEAAFKFIRGQEDKPGYLMSPKMAHIGTLSFWMFVEASDGAEKLKITSQTGFTMAKTLIEITTADINGDTWTLFEVDVNEHDSTVLTFTPSLTSQGDTRLWMDDLKISGNTVSSRDHMVNTPVVSLFPNPASDHLDLSIPENSYSRFEVYNMVGQNVRNGEITGTTMRLPLEGLNGGIYVISFSGEAGNYNTKFIRK